MKKLIKIILGLSIVGIIQAQTVTQCIDYTNLDAALCQYGPWGNPTERTGKVDYGPQAVLSRHTVHTDVNERDPRTFNQLRTTLPDGRPSVRLGNWGDDKEAERITYTYSVPTDNPVLMLHYAAVLQNPGHKKRETQPRFTMDIMDIYGHQLSSQCFSFDFLSGISGTANWHSEMYKEPDGYKAEALLWSDWATMGINLNEFAGQTIKIVLTTYDCAYMNGHWGYAYFGFDCTTDKLTVSTCGEYDQTTSFTAPVGFNYRWYAASNPSKVLSTDQTYIPATPGETYYCDVINKENTNCYFTLVGTAGGRFPIANFDAQQHHGYCGDTIYLTNLSGISPDNINLYSPRQECDAYLWDFGDGRTSTAIQPGYVVYTTPGTYTIKLKAGLNDWDCTSDEKQYTFTVKAGEETQELFDTICAGSSITLGDTTLMTAGVYTRDVLDPDCSMIIHVIQHLHVIEPVYKDVYDTICNNGSLYWHGSILTEAGDYPVTLSTYHFGCDSIVTLHLTVNSISITETEYDTICYGEFYLWHNRPLYKAGLYCDTLINIHGCDSITYLQLSLYDTQSPPKSLLRRLKNEDGSYVLPDGWEDPYINGGGSDIDPIETLPSPWNDPYMGGEIPPIDPSDNPTQWHDPYMTGDTIDVPIIDPDDQEPQPWKDPYMMDIEHDTICGQDCFEWRGKTYCQSGLYADTLTSIYGCDSLVFLDLLLNTAFFDHQVIVLNQGESYTWKRHFNEDGSPIIVKKEGEYFDTIPDPNGCDSVWQLTVMVNYKSYDTTIYVTNCPDEEIYYFNGKPIIFPGTYTDSLKSQYGKDSVVTLIFDYYEDYAFDTIIKACGDSYVWRGKTLTKSGEYEDVYKTINGCDSVYYLSLQLYTSFPQTLDTTICAGDAIRWQDSVYQHAGQYHKQVLGPEGCYSDFYLNLTIDSCCQIHSAEIDSTICDSQLPFAWLGKFYSTEGTYIDTTNTAQGCDSIVTLHLFILKSSESHDTTSVCYNDLPFTWNDQTIDKAGEYEFHTTNSVLCDSTAYLVVYATDKPKTDNRQITICENNSFKWYNRTLTKAGVYDTVLYYKNGCDSIYAHLELNVGAIFRDTIFDTICIGDIYPWHGKDYTQEGEYTITAIGQDSECDSVLTLKLHVKDCTPPLPPECISIVGQIEMTDTLCANDAFLTLEYTYTEGAPKTYKIIFDTAAKNQQFADQAWESTFFSEGSAQIAIPIPAGEDSSHYVRPDTYSATLVVVDTCDKEIKYPISFTLIYPSWIIFQRWNDVLAIYNENYNGGYTFSQIRWFNDNGEIISDAPHHSYIYQPPHLDHHQPYWVVLTRSSDGKTLPSCKFYPTEQSNETIYTEEVEFIFVNGIKVVALRDERGIIKAHKILEIQ